MIVIVSPAGEMASRLVERREQRFIRAFIAQPADKALRKGVLLRFARRNIMLIGVGFLTPLENRHRGEFGAVVGNACPRLAA